MVTSYDAFTLYINETIYLNLSDHLSDLKEWYGCSSACDATLEFMGK